jgi:hypothetical protein
LIAKKQLFYDVNAAEENYAGGAGFIPLFME